MIEANNLMTFSLLLANIVLYLITQSNFTVFDACKHYPFQEKSDKSFYRWILSGFVHANLMHLAFNLFVLYQFGATVEALYKSIFGFIPGGLLFLLTYFLILVFTGLPSYLKHKNNRMYSSVGASGALSGILFIYIVFFPGHILYIMGLIPLPAIFFGALYLIYSWWAAGRFEDSIDHDAHYFGALSGILFGVILKFIIL